MPKKKEPELTPEEQIKRFKEAAKKAGLTDKEEEFERASRQVTKPAALPKRGHPSGHGTKPQTPVRAPR